jgi:hypothetical protein
MAIEARNKNLYCAIVSLELKKAFDTLDHYFLILKLLKLGVYNGVLKLFKSYLSKRYQYVVSKNVKSSIKNLSIGVPLGSILGSLLFSRYIDDITRRFINGIFVLYADDIYIIFKHKNINQLNTLINNDLKVIMEWFIQNKLVVNQQKTSCIVCWHRILM